MATIPNQTTSAATSYQTSTTKRTPGLTFSRHFTRPGVSPFDEIVWELRDAVIQDFKFEPHVHVHYGEAVVRVKDGLPKQKDLPTQLAGSGTLLPE